MRTAKIYVYVYGKTLSSELTDLTVFDKSEPKPGIPGGITFTKENGSWMNSFLARSFCRIL